MRKSKISKLAALVLVLAMGAGMITNTSIAEAEEAGVTYKEPSSVGISGYADSDMEVFGFTPKNWRGGPIYSLDGRFYVSSVIDNNISVDEKKAYKYKWFIKTGGNNKYVIFNTATDNNWFAWNDLFSSSYGEVFSVYYEVSAPDGSWTKSSSVIEFRRLYKVIIKRAWDGGDDAILYKYCDKDLIIPDGPDDSDFVGWEYKNGDVYSPGSQFGINEDNVVLSPVYKNKSSMKLYFKGTDKIKYVAGTSKQLDVYFADDNTSWDFSDDSSADMLTYDINKNGKPVTVGEKYGYLDKDGKLHFGTKCGKYFLILYYSGNDYNTSDKAYIDYIVVPGKIKKSTIKISKKGIVSTVKWGKSIGAEKYKLNIVFKDGKKWPVEITKKTKKKTGSLKDRFYKIKYKKAIKSVTITPIGAGLSGAKTTKKR